MRAILKFLLWSLLAVLFVLAAFRVAAAIRETEDRQTAAPDRGSFVQSDLGEVYVEQTGPVDGPPVMLVHGSVGWAHFWVETSEALAAAGYRVIAFDLSPMGYSQADPNNDYSRINQAARIGALARAMQIKPALVAHSFGAGPATEAVMRMPDAFSSFVIVDGAIGVGSHEAQRALPWPLRSQWIRELAVSATITNPFAMKPLLKLFLHRKEAATDRYVALLKEPYTLSGTTSAIARWLPTLLTPPKDALSTRTGSYASISMPVGIIWGDQDTATPLAQGEQLHALIAGSKLEVLPGLGHIPQIEGPEAFQAALIGLLDGFPR